MQAWIATPESIADQRMIAQQVFETMVDIELIPAEQHLAEAEIGAISSVLRYTGPCEGVMLIECTRGLAFTFTARLMSIDLPEEIDANVLDSMGELVNMIGGNLKGLMPEETSISTPVVMLDSERDALLASSKRLSRVCFNAGAEHCCVSLLTSS